MTEHTTDINETAAALADMIPDRMENASPPQQQLLDIGDATTTTNKSMAASHSGAVQDTVATKAGDREDAGEPSIAPEDDDAGDNGETGDEIVDGNGDMAPLSDVDGKDTGVATATGIFASFPRSPVQKDEFRVPLNSLIIGVGGPQRSYDFETGAGEALLHAALDPDALEPVVVMQADDNWPVIDGWARVDALRQQFGDTANVMVRVVRWDGTARDALYKRFSAAFLTVNSRKIDRSTLLADFHATWAVPQQVLAARIGWMESRVTKELGAARAFAEAPEFAALHLKADNPPIDYLYKVQQALEAAVKDDAEHPKRSPEKSAVGKLKAKLEALLVKPERFATAEALAKLGIGATPKAKPGKTDQIADGVSLAACDPEIVDCIDGADGEPIAIVEKTQDDQLSIRLVVDVAGMDEPRKEEVRSKLREAIDKLLG